MGPCRDKFGPMNIQRTIDPPGDDTGYDTDFLAWTIAQADALRARDMMRIDWDNLIEEIESLGKSQRKELMSRLTIILVHLLKYQHGVDPRPRIGWRNTIVAQRVDLLDLLQENPSLKREVESVLESKYPVSRLQALGQLEEHEPDRMAHYSSVLPESLPYSPKQALDLDWLPDPPA